MFAIPDRTTEHYLYCLLNAIADWGIPRAIRTDNDKSFTSDLCKRFDVLLNILSILQLCRIHLQETPLLKDQIKILSENYVC